MSFTEFLVIVAVFVVCLVGVLLMFPNPMIKGAGISGYNPPPPPTAYIEGNSPLHTKHSGFYTLS